MLFETFLLLSKHCTSSLIFLVTQKNYLIIIERVDKLSRKNIYLRKILKLDLDLKIFGLRIWIMLHFTGFGLKIFGQRFIITLIRYFTGVGLENTWTTNLDYKYYILRDLDLKHLDYGSGFWLLFISLDLDLKILGLGIWITIIRFYWIWTWKYLDCDLGLRLI